MSSLERYVCVLFFRSVCVCKIKALKLLAYLKPLDALSLLLLRWLTHLVCTALIRLKQHGIHSYIGENINFDSFESFYSCACSPICAIL